MMVWSRSWGYYYYYAGLRWLVVEAMSIVHGRVLSAWKVQDLNGWTKVNSVWIRDSVRHPPGVSGGDDRGGRYRLVE